MEWPWVMFFGPSFAVVGIIFIYIYVRGLIDLKRAGRLWQDGIKRILVCVLIFVGLLLFSPLILGFGCLATLCYFLDDEDWEHTKAE